MEINTNDRTILAAPDTVKLHGQESAVLAAVFPLTVEKPAHDALIGYLNENEKDVTGPHIVLLFIGNRSIPFAVIRPVDEKEMYENMVGSEFNVVIRKPSLDGYERMR